MSSLCAIIITLSTTHALLQENKELIDRLNDEQPTAQFGANQFAHTPISEFQHTRLINIDPSQMQRTVANKEPREPSLTEIPESWDWRDHDVVTAVKDQYCMYPIQIS